MEAVLIKERPAVLVAPTFQLVMAAGGPDADEVAAALAAITSYLEAERQAQAVASAERTTTSGWYISKIMLQQGLGLAHTPTAASWANLDRVRWGYAGVPGIVGH